MNTELNTSQPKRSRDDKSHDYASHCLNGLFGSQAAGLGRWDSSTICYLVEVPKGHPARWLTRRAD